jgi:hypothetical protein
MKNWNVQFLLEIIFHPQIMIPHEEINRIIEVLLVYPNTDETFGTTVLYSNQKSNKSPIKKKSFITFNFVQPCYEFLFSRKLTSGVGAPKC